MAYTDENGKGCELQYSVTVWAGEDEGIRQYFWASEEQIETAVNRFKKCPLAYNLMDLCVRSKAVKITPDVKERRLDSGWDKLVGRKELISEIEINVMDERWADLCAKKLGLPIPFPNIKYDPLS